MGLTLSTKVAFNAQALRL